MAINAPRLQRADTSGLRQSFESPLKALSDGITQGINTKLKLRQQDNNDKILAAQENKAKRALDKQKKMDKLIDEGGTPEEVGDRLAAGGFFSEAKQAFATADRADEKRLRAAQLEEAETTTGLRAAQTADIQTDNQRAALELKEKADQNKRTTIVDIGRTHPSLAGKMIAAEPALWNLSEQAGSTAESIMVADAQAADQSKNKTSTSPKEIDVERMISRFDSEGMDLGFLGFGGVFGDKANKQVAANDGAGYAKMLQMTRGITTAEAEETALNMIKAASSGGLYNPSMAASLISRERALLGRVNGTLGVAKVPTKEKIAILRKAKDANNGVLPQKDREQWNAEYGTNFPADTYAPSDADLMKEAADGAPIATEVNEKVTTNFIKPKEDTSILGGIKRAGAKLVSQGDAGQKKANKEFFKRQRKEVADKKKLESNKKKIAELKALDRKIGAGKRANVAATTRRRDRIERMQKENEAISDGLGLGSTSPSPKEVSSEPLTTRQQTEAVLSQATTGKAPTEKNRESFKVGMAASESTGDPKIIVGNEEAGTHKMGLYQFGIPRLKDLGYVSKAGKWTGKNGIQSQDDFLDSPQEQTIAFNEHTKRLEASLTNSSQNSIAFEALNGSVIGGVKITTSGLVGATHLLGGGSKDKIGVRNAMRQALPKRILNAPDSAKEIARKKLTPAEKKETQRKFKKLMAGSKDDFGTSGWAYIKKFEGYY